MQEMASAEFKTAIVWFRRDLRVDDNPALVAALAAATNVIPVFIWAAEEEGQFQPGRCTRWWTKHSLIDLQQALAALGSRLIIRRSNDSTAALLQVVADVGAEAVFFNHLYDPISLMRDHDCKRGLAAAGVAHRSFNADMLYEPWEVLDDNKQPLSTFNDFWTRVRSMPVPPPFPVSAPAYMPPVPAGVASLTAADVDWFFTAEQEASSDQLKFKWKPGVAGAIAELERFLGDRLSEFEHDRAKVDRDSTSRLSPWIHIGSISVRYIFYRVRQCQGEWAAAGVDKTVSCDDFLQQMGYREYSRYLAFHFPFIHERSLLRHLRACPWRIDQQAFKAWRQGQTGYPLVDAAMRQLWSSGWCHNRARVVAASFMVKDLLLPWQWGLKHYWEAQIDADLECDALGWQYVSGGMSDAHPFSYMMDLEVEAKRFDPDGEYVRRWLPALSRLPNQYIHAPWKAPPQVLAAADVELGSNYPLPIISREQATANVAYACSVLDKSVAPAGGAPGTGSESSGRYPYRAPTYPLGGAGGVTQGGAGRSSSGAGPSGTAGGSTGAEPTGGAAPYGGAGAESLPPSSAAGGQRPGQPESRSVSAAGSAGAPPSSGGGNSGSRPDARAMAPPPPQPPLSSGQAGQHAHPHQPAGAHHAQQQQQAHYAVHHPQRGNSGATGGGSGGAPGGSGGQGPAGSGPPAAAPGGGVVYYHPGEAAGQEALEEILQQQRRARGITARQQDGSGTNNSPPYQQQHHHAAGGGAAAAAGAQLPPGGRGPYGAGAWPPAAGGEGGGREEGGDEEVAAEAAGLWTAAQQQLLLMQDGGAALAFQQAMQMLLARRRMRDGVSAFVGEAGPGAGARGVRGEDGEGEGGDEGEEGDSEEVVSNTVDFNYTALTGASAHRQTGTARGARRAAAGMVAAAAAAAATAAARGRRAAAAAPAGAAAEKRARKEEEHEEEEGGGEEGGVRHARRSSEGGSDDEAMHEAAPEGRGEGQRRRRERPRHSGEDAMEADGGGGSGEDDDDYDRDCGSDGSGGGGYDKMEEADADGEVEGGSSGEGEGGGGSSGAVKAREAAAPVAAAAAAAHHKRARSVGDGEGLDWE